jgi:hypothetical protein
MERRFNIAKTFFHCYSYFCIVQEDGEEAGEEVTIS